MGKKQIGRYVYWSARRIEQVASENGITLAARSSYVLKTPQLPKTPILPQAELNIASRSRTRLDDARRIENGLGRLVSNGLTASLRITRQRV